VYLPRRDAQLENERRQEKAQADAQKRVAQERSLAERKKAEQRQAETKASAEAHYQTCLNKANMTHESSWAAECKRLAEKALADHSECLTKPKLPKGYCDAAYRLRDASPGCVLPQKVATGLDGDLSEARNRCQRERRAALQ
jgi:membrane protein involved in colicin uptake